MTVELEVWSVYIRKLGIPGTDVHEFLWNVVTQRNATEKEVVDTIKQHHTPAWWENYIVTGFKYQGCLVEIQNGVI